MRKLTRRLLVCSYFLVFSFVLGQVKLHQWTNQSGQTITAKFVKGDEETVILFLNSRNYDYKLSDLNEKSQALARRLIEAAKPPERPPPVAKAPRPPPKNTVPNPNGIGYSAAEIKRVLDEHNRLRREVGLTDLTWDPRLALHSQTWADTMAREQAFEHSKGSGEGENIAYAKGYNRFQSIDLALSGWGEKEKILYLERNEPVVGGKGFDGVGHYTQMVWHETTRVGMATAMAADGKFYTCARYLPVGNIVGERPYRKTTR